VRTKASKREKERKEANQQKPEAHRDFSRALRGRLFTARSPPVGAHSQLHRFGIWSFSKAAANNSDHYQHLFHLDSKALGQQIWLGTGESLPSAIRPDL